MFELATGKVTRDCTGLSRRSFLRVGSLSALGLSLPEFLRMKAQASSPAARRNISCIFMWMQGGPSHHDTLDPKPDAPAEVRGEFATIQTALPGIRFCEHLPLLAKQTDKFSLIRGHDPQNGSHGTADCIMMSGHKYNPSLAYPCYGSVIAKERGYNNGMLPFVQLGRYIDRRFHGGIPGFLGDQYAGFEVHDDPNGATFQVRDLSVAADKQARLARRFAMLSEVDRYQATAEELSTAVKARDAFYEKAHGLI